MHRSTYLVNILHVHPIHPPAAPVPLFYFIVPDMTYFVAYLLPLPPTP